MNIPYDQLCNELLRMKAEPVASALELIELRAKLNAIQNVFSVDHGQTCLQHTDAERQAAGCPVCLKVKLEAAKADRVRFWGESRHRQAELVACQKAVAEMREICRLVIEADEQIHGFAHHRKEIVRRARLSLSLDCGKQSDPTKPTTETPNQNQ